MRIPSEYGGVSFHITKYENLRKIGSRSKLVEFLKEIVDDYKGNIGKEVYFNRIMDYITNQKAIIRDDGVIDYFYEEDDRDFT